jgi:two-component system sensor histidine kinase/response regulator
MAFIRPRHSLNSRVTLTTLIIFVLGLWLLSFFASQMLRKDMQRLLGEQQFATAAMVASQVSSELENRISTLTKVAALAAPAMQAGPLAMQSFVEQRPALQSMFNGGLVAVDRSGTAIADYPVETGRLGINYMDIDGVASALKEDKPSISQPILGKKIKAAIFAISVPIRDSQGEVIGALSGITNLALPNFLDRITESRYGRTGNYFLVAVEQRLIVTSSKKDRIMGSLPKLGTFPAIDHFFAGYEGSAVYVNQFGSEVLASIKRIPLANWTVSSSLTTEEAFAPIRAMQQRMLLATLLLTLVAGGLTWWLLRQELAPMLAAARTLSAMSDATQPLQALPVVSKDEIGQMVGGFNRLLETLGQREEALKESLDRLEKIASRLPGVIFQFRLRRDGHACIPYASKALFDIYQVHPAEVVDCFDPILEKIHPQDKENFEKSIAASALSLETWRHEYRVKFDDGTTRWLHGSAAPEPEADGAILWHGFITDVTARKESEAELNQYRHHLEKLVEERTAALSIAKEIAESASRAKSTFLANMSHELRTPMNAILGMTDLALRRAADAKQIEQLHKVSNASQHLLSIINNILDISKIEAERMALEQIVFRLGTVLENLRSLISQKISEKGLQLLIDLPEELAQQAMRGDPVRLGQILLNLAGNASKFTASGSITISVRSSEEDDASILLRFEVRDTGIGISSADQARLFTAFEQADSSMTRQYGGSGLGLAISKRLVQLMGGSIGIESQPGVGSTFWFTARFAKTTDYAEGVALAQNSTAEATIREQFSGSRILLAEDEPINQEVSRELLEELGLQVDLAENGIVAVDMAKQTNYSLILMDIQMPGMNGLQATQAIRALPGRQHTPILAMTANAFDEDRQRCIAVGMNDHIAKPVDPEVLFETLLKWLRVAQR